MNKLKALFILVLLLEIFTTNSINAQEKHNVIRALHFRLLGISLEEAKRLADEASKHRFNTLVIDVLWGASVRLKSFPWIVQVKPWEREDLIEFVRYARAQHLEIVPQFQTLSHQHVLLGKYRPDLMFNQQTYDPNKKEVYDLILPMLDELIDLIKPSAVHIGHDEVVGWELSHFGKFLLQDERPLLAELFLKDVLTMYEHLKSKGIETWMWGDMLISPDEFPDLPEESKRPFHGTLAGYGKQLRAKLPKDIVICDWHYNDEQEEFPSLTAFQKEGFRVIGVTWVKEKTIKNFSRYAAKHNAYGMMATTWGHVQKRNWDIVERIIKISGDTFSKDFADGK
ncbi:MAG: family 20 glycosylhydrolase [candidate division WOR-3 bacterium]